METLWQRVAYTLYKNKLKAMGDKTSVDQYRNCCDVVWIDRLLGITRRLI